MKRRPVQSWTSRTLLVLMIFPSGLSAQQAPAAPASAQKGAAAAAKPAAASTTALDNLVAPIALYPDALVARTAPTATSSQLQCEETRTSLQLQFREALDLDPNCGQTHVMLGRTYPSPFRLAYVHLGLGDTDVAFDWLEKSVEARDWQLGMLKVEPAFDGLRSDPRFAALFGRVGLPR